MWRAGLVVVAAAGLPLAACKALAPYGATPGQVSPDQGLVLVDGAVDARDDAALVDALADLATVDGSGDLAPTETVGHDFAPRDGDPADASGPETSPAEAGADLGDAARPAPCATNATQRGSPASWSSSMAVCDGPSWNWNQCTAGDLCGAGWHLCNPTEYRDRGGLSEGPGMGNPAWLDGCIRENAAPFSPTPTTCGTYPWCNSPNADSASVFWICGGGAVGQQTWEGVLGLVTSSACRRVGDALDSDAEAYWRPEAADWRGTSAVCCLD